MAEQKEINFNPGLTGVSISMQNVPDISFRKLGIFIDISDYKENMAIGPPRYCFSLGIVVSHMAKQRIV